LIFYAGSPHDISIDNLKKRLYVFKENFACFSNADKIEIVTYKYSKEQDKHILGARLMFEYCLNKNQTWNTIRPGSDSALAKTYYQELHSEIRDKLTSLMTIRTVIDSLRERNFPFIMTCMDELLFDRTYNATSTIQYLQDYVEPYMTRFEGKTFLDWSRNHGYPESASWHPLEQAHAAGAEVMRQAFDKQNTNGR
jgi:hypothetical protein